LEGFHFMGAIHSFVRTKEFTKFDVPSNFFFFCGELFTPQSNPGLEDHTLQAVGKCVLNTSRLPGPRPGWRRIACVFHLQWWLSQKLYCGESLLFSAVRYRSAAVLLENGCTNPGRQATNLLNCVRWHLIFVGPRYGIRFTSPLWRLEMNPCVRNFRVGALLYYPPFSIL